MEWQASLPVWQHFAVKHGAISCLSITEHLCRAAAARDRCCMPIHCSCNIETKAEYQLMLCCALCTADAVSCLEYASSNELFCLPGASISRNTAAHQQSSMPRRACEVLDLWRHAGDYSGFFVMQGRQTQFLPTGNDHAMELGGTVREPPSAPLDHSSHHALTACA